MPRQTFSVLIITGRELDYPNHYYNSSLIHQNLTAKGEFPPCMIPNVVMYEGKEHKRKKLLVYTFLGDLKEFCRSFFCHFLFPLRPLKFL